MSFNSRRSFDWRSSGGNSKRSIEKDKQNFPTGLNPWTEYHFDNRFKLIDPELVAKENAYVRDFYLSRLRTLSSIRSEVGKAVARVQAGEEYVSKKGEFLEKRWRKWMNGHISDLKRVQKESQDAIKESRLILFRKQTSQLQEVSRCINYQVLKLSADLYEEKGLALDPMDTDVKKHELDTNGDPRRRKRLKSVNLFARSLLDSLPKVPKAKEPTPKGKDPKKPKADKKPKGS